MLQNEVITLKIPVLNAEEALAVLGPQDRFLRVVEEKVNVKISSRDAEITVVGERKYAESVEQFYEVLLQLVREGYSPSERDITYALDMALIMRADELLDLFKKPIATTYRGKKILVKTLGQRHYVKLVKKLDIVFGIGPAGTGKTYLAVVMAVTALKENLVKRIILTRPAVEAGENLGFLPGDLQEKVDPYLRPLYDALHDVLGAEQTVKAIERGMIEIAPLAYMRGRTLDDAFIILDEAQNTTPEQMKMFLTRLGFGSKMVITGDVTQIDLPRGKNSGLIEAKRILQNIDEIGMMIFTEQDVVRHTLVQKIIMAYDRDAESKA